MSDFGPLCECGERRLSATEAEADRCRYCDIDTDSKNALRQAGINSRHDAKRRKGAE